MACKEPTGTARQQTVATLGQRTRLLRPGHDKIGAEKIATGCHNRRAGWRGRALSVGAAICPTALLSRLTLHPRCERLADFKDLVVRECW